MPLPGFSGRGRQGSRAPRVKWMKRVQSNWTVERTIIVLLLFTIMLLLLTTRSSRPLSRSDRSAIFGDEDVLAEHASSREKEPIRLFIAIGSAPKNGDLRQAARDTWLRWIPQDFSITYRFFTDAKPEELETVDEIRVWRAIGEEKAKHGDIVEQRLPGGYGSNEHNVYGRRGIFQMRWGLTHERMSHFLRIDDDSFLCLHRLRYELMTLPTRQFFWGRFWCRHGRNRADENFMLFSSDVVRVLADSRLTGGLLPFDPSVTLGWNFGYWSWVLNLTIFDDQDRIDAQQGYLTQFMHPHIRLPMSFTPRFASAKPHSFCDHFMFAHHVDTATMHDTFDRTRTHLMYKLPTRRGPDATCHRADHSFVPGRHSKVLPNVKLERAVDA